MNKEALSISMNICVNNIRNEQKTNNASAKNANLQYTVWGIKQYGENMTNYRCVWCVQLCSTSTDLNPQ